MPSKEAKERHNLRNQPTLCTGRKVKVSKSVELKQRAPDGQDGCDWFHVSVDGEDYILPSEGAAMWLAESRALAKGEQLHDDFTALKAARQSRKN